MDHRPIRTRVVPSRKRPIVPEPGVPPGNASRGRHSVILYSSCRPVSGTNGPSRGPTRGFRPPCPVRPATAPGSEQVRRTLLSETRKRRQEPPTRLLTPPTHLSADAAVFMVHSMQLALLGARNARSKTALDDSPGDRQVNSCATRQDGRRGGTLVRTVEVRPYALDQRDDVGLCHAGIGTRSAGLEAGDALFDALDQCFIEGRPGTRVGVGHLSDNQGHGEILP